MVVETQHKNMKKSFLDILTIARENVKKNPSIFGYDTYEVASRYMAGLKDEVEEVRAEMRENNTVYLADELSDLAWDYAVLIALLEDRGLIVNAEDVLEHGYQKYSERAPAFLEASSEKWDEVKIMQKQDLQRQHQEKYGN